MSEARTLLVETAERLFSDLSRSPEAPITTVWSAIAESGFPSLLLAEETGGFGGDFGDLFAVARTAGRHALAAPVGEAALAAWLLAAAGLEPAETLGVIGLADTVDTVDGRFNLVLAGVPWGGDADVVVIRVADQLVRLSVADATVERRFSPAGEPRDRLTFRAAPGQTGPLPSALIDLDLLALGALIRTAQIAGAMDAALEASIAYANDRVQFGKPIAKFQAVQQSLAVFAIEAAAANSAGQAAARAADAGDAGLEIEAAKIRANLAAGHGAALAHQVHGAIGFTLEYPLHRLTRRLTAWRSEFGGDRLWSERLGRRVAALGGAGLWPELARRADARD